MHLHCPIPYIHRLMFYIPSPKDINIFNFFMLFREDIEYITADFPLLNIQSDYCNVSRQHMF